MSVDTRPSDTGRFENYPNCAHCGQPIEPPFVPLANLATGYVDGTRAVHQRCWQAWLAGGSSPSTPSTESTGGAHGL